MWVHDSCSRETGTVDDLKAAVGELQALDPGDPLPGQPFRPGGQVVQGLPIGEHGIMMVSPHDTLADVIVVGYVGPDLPRAAG
ncbi:MAG: hypothetical protein ACR2HR_07630 [Euzebya sp.]